MTEPTRIYPWPTVEELAEADRSNVNCTWDALRDFDEDLPAVIEEAAALHDELTRVTKTSYAAEQAEFQKIADEIGEPEDTLLPIMLGKRRIPKGHSHRKKIIYAQQLYSKSIALVPKAIVLLMIGRAYMWAVTDLLRLRVTSAYGYVRNQAEGVALLRIFDENPTRAAAWMEVETDEDGFRFYRKTQKRLNQVLDKVGLKHAYEIGSGYSQHVRLAGASHGFAEVRQEGEGQPMHRLGVSLQEIDVDNLIPFYGAVLFVLETQGLVFSAIPQVLDGGVRNRRIPEFVERVQQLKELGRERYEEELGSGVG